MNTPRPRLSRISRRVAWLVVAGWLILIAVLTAVAPALDAVKSNDNDNPPAGSMSMRAAVVAEQEFGTESAPPAVIVVRSDSQEETRDATGRLVNLIQDADLPAVVDTVDASMLPRGGGLVSQDGSTEMILVQLTGSAGGEDYRGTVDELRTLTSSVADGTVETAVTGPAGIVADASEVFGGGDRILLLGTVALVVVLLAAIYRSPVLVAVALLGVGLAMRLAEGAGALLADAGVIQISGQTASIMTVLLFGVGTDYALIIFARFREAIADHPDPRVAVAVAMRSVAGALAASVSTIVVAVLALLVAVTPTLHDFGPYLALGVASMAAVAFTLTPALLVLCGRFAFWPRRAVSPDRETRGSRVWNKVADVAIDAPKRVLAAGLALLILMAGGLLGAQQSFDLVSGFRLETESAAGRAMVADAFGPGVIAPSDVLVQAGRPIEATQVRAVATSLATSPDVATVGATSTSKDGRVARISVVLKSNPYGSEAMAAVPRIVDRAEAGARQAGVSDPEVLIGGETAVAADTRGALDRDLVVVGLLMIMAVSLILGLVLRSILAPVYIGLTLLLSYAATMGLTSFITITLGGDLGIGNRVAVYVLIFLVALGVDYTIFMLTRYRQELVTRTPVEALRVSIVRTGGVISSAGIILAGTFAVLMTQPIRELYQFGLAMAIGILLDTFIVRPLLVPACIRLLGRHALWPSRPAHP
ncbi:putative membrane protein [Aeromicrobium flavum]|uniref:Putative membrane protein n=1 Tax=Aeromicrobium flavum TaxID=416568 RepID=A0A512HRC1_9ACTN|nr:MMPL family transporter [Aeromicrobium flavum]GEO88003.1 putative membrane protein [Aeromicrobium flavum]